MSNPLYNETGNDRGVSNRVYLGQLQKNSDVQVYPTGKYLGKMEGKSGETGLSGKNGGKNIGMSKNNGGKDMNMSGKRSGYTDGNSTMRSNG